MYGLIKAAEQLGFSAKGVKGNQEAFFSEFPLPAIAHVIVNENLLHYVVIHKISKNQIIIAHRLSTIKNCDKIFVFENGDIIESRRSSSQC